MFTYYLTHRNEIFVNDGIEKRKTPTFDLKECQFNVISILEKNDKKNIWLLLKPKNDRANEELFRLRGEENLFSQAIRSRFVNTIFLSNILKSNQAESFFKMNALDSDVLYLKVKLAYTSEPIEHLYNKNSVLGNVVLSIKNTFSQGRYCGYDFILTEETKENLLDYKN